MSEASAESPQSQPASPARPFWYPSRIITLSLLAVALVALAFDLSARFKQRSAFGALQSYVDENITETPQNSMNEPPTPSRVKTILGRTPDRQQEGQEELSQTYTWAGVFNRYHVHAHYGGVTLAAENPADAEPLLLRVEQSSNYVWEN